MVGINDLVEDWIQIRSTLQRQLKILQPGGALSERDMSESARETTISRLKGCVEVMNALLKENARAHQV